MCYSNTLLTQSGIECIFYTSAGDRSEEEDGLEENSQMVLTVMSGTPLAVIAVIVIVIAASAVATSSFSVCRTPEHTLAFSQTTTTTTKASETFVRDFQR